MNRMSEEGQQPADVPREPANATLETTKNWRAELAAWLAQNPKVIPDELRQLREEFVRRFPKEKISEWTLKQFALGHDENRDSFCYWLERKTRYLGSILGGNVF